MTIFQSANSPSSNKVLSPIEEREIKEYIVSILTKDMGKDLAKKIIAEYNSINELKKIYKITASLWAPIIFEFAKWCDKYSREYPDVPLKFAMRDAEPFAIAYNLLKNNGEFNEEEYRKSLIWINRKVCAIPTEDVDYKPTGFAEQILFKKYIKQEGLNKPFFFVDAGCWGTIIKELHSNDGMGFQGIPLFFFSHNQSIPSFLAEMKVPEDIGEVFNDSIEAFFPKEYKSVEKFTRDSGIIKPELSKEEKMEQFYKVFIASLKENIKEYVKNGTTFDMDKILMDLASAKQQSEEKFTGILPNSTPGTVDREKFNEEWKKVFKTETCSIDKWMEYLTEKERSLRVHE